MGPHKLLSKIVDGDLVAVRQPTKPFETWNVEKDSAADNWRDRLYAMPFPAAVVAQLRRGMSTVDAAIFLDVDERIDVGADVQRPKH